MNKVFTSSLVGFFMLIFLSAPWLASADGMMIDPYPGRWDYGQEKDQQALINYENGWEKMILSISTEKANTSSSVWLFPVPAEPSEVAVDVLKEMPSLQGENIATAARISLQESRDLSLRTQVYPIIPLFLFSNIHGYSSLSLGGNDSLTKSGGTQGVANDVQVFEHLEKEGMVTEIVTAKTANGLYDYLKSKGLNIEAGSIPVIDSYVGKSYSFVANWLDPVSVIDTAATFQEIKDNLKQYYLQYIQGGVMDRFRAVDTSIKQKHLGQGEDLLSMDHSATYNYLNSVAGENLLNEYVEAINKDQTILTEFWRGSKDYAPAGWVQRNDQQAKINLRKGVLVSFKTDKIFFPLLPTSVYGSKIVPATVRVIGRVTPELYDSIKNYTTVEYFHKGSLSANEDISGFLKGSIANLDYTKIDLTPPSKFLTADLWFNNKLSLQTWYTYAATGAGLVLSLIMLAILSMSAGLIAGLIVFKESRNYQGMVKAKLFGLWNLATLIGLVIATFFKKTENLSAKSDELLGILHRKGYHIRRRWALILLIIGTPWAIISLIFTYAFFGEVIRCFIETGYTKEYACSSLIGTGSVFAFILFILPPYLIFWGIKRLGKIQIEDKPLFQELKAEGYSTWTLKDRRKIKYLIVYSLVFVVLTVLVYWLLELMLLPKPTYVFSLSSLF